MSTIKTPRTDAVHKAIMDLPWESVLELPDGYPPCNPWELARELELENTLLKRKLESLLGEGGFW